MLSDASYSRISMIPAENKAEIQNKCEKLKDAFADTRINSIRYYCEDNLEADVIH